MSNATAAAATLSPFETAFVHLLNTVPERWATFDRDQLTDAESNALVELNLAGLIEIRSSVTVSMEGQSVTFSYTRTQRGEVFPAEDRDREKNIGYPDWLEPYERWLESPAGRSDPFRTTVTGPEWWRMTETGVSTRDVMRGKSLGKLRWAIGRFSTPSRPPIKGRLDVSSVVRNDQKRGDAVASPSPTPTPAIVADLIDAGPPPASPVADGPFTDASGKRFIFRGDRRTPISPYEGVYFRIIEFLWERPDGEKVGVLQVWKAAGRKTNPAKTAVQLRDSKWATNNKGPVNNLLARCGITYRVLVVDNPAGEMWWEGRGRLEDGAENAVGENG